MAKRKEKGSGTISYSEKKKLWHGKYTKGIDGGTGLPIRKSVYGKTQAEVAKKIRKATAELDSGTHKEPSKMPLRDWLDIWLNEYNGHMKEKSLVGYRNSVEYRIKPQLGAKPLKTITHHDIQNFVNNQSKDQPKKKLKAVAPKTVKNLHGIIHKALGQAVINEYIPSNPATDCVLPRFVKPEIMPLDDEKQINLYAQIKDHRHRDFILFAIYEGMRESEIIGLTFDRVNFEKGTIHIDRQLQLITPKKDKADKPKKRLVGKYGAKGNYVFELPKHDKIRTITPAQSSMDLLQAIKAQQEQWAERAGQAWANDKGFVFVNELGEHYRSQTVYTSLKRIMKKLFNVPVNDNKTKVPRLHDLRHTFAVSALQDNVDPKAVSEHMGHYSVAFTLDTYHHFTPHLRKKSAEQRDEKIKRLKADSKPN